MGGMFDWSKRRRVSDAETYAWMRRRGIYVAPDVAEDRYWHPWRYPPRAAGVIGGPDVSPPPVSLPPVGNFAATAQNAFWQFGTTLALTSGVNILHDARENLNITAGTVGYTQALVDAVVRDVQTRLGTAAGAVPQPLPPDPTATGNAQTLPTVSRGLLQWILWSTYHAGGTHPASRPQDVRLPSTIIAPSMNTDASGLAANYPVRFFPGVTGDFYAQNPFTGQSSPPSRVGVIQQPVIDVVGTPPRRTSSSSNGAVLAAFALVAALATVGSSK